MGKDPSNGKSFFLPKTFHRKIPPKRALPKQPAKQPNPDLGWTSGVSTSRLSDAISRAMGDMPKNPLEYLRQCDPHTINKIRSALRHPEFGTGDS